MRIWCSLVFVLLPACSYDFDQFSVAADQQPRTLCTEENEVRLECQPQCENCTSLSEGNPCPASQYLDLSMDSPECRDRFLAVGADERTLTELLEDGVRSTPACDQLSVQQAIDATTVAGGGTVLLPACRLVLTQSLRLSAGVILLGQGVAETTLALATPHTATTRNTGSRWH